MFRRLPSRLGFAVRGVVAALRMDQAFGEHLVCAILVAVSAAVLRVSLIEACLLALCIAGVIAAEMFNTSIEQMAKAVDDEHHPLLGHSLDIAAGGVLIASLGAAVVGLLIFGYRLGLVFHWWTNP